MWFKKVKQEQRIRRWLFPAGQLAIATGIMLGRLENPSLAFLTGVLMGFGLVTSLAFLICYSRKMRS